VLLEKQPVCRSSSSHGWGSRGYRSISSALLLLLTLGEEEMGAGILWAAAGLAGSGRWRSGGRSCWEAGRWAAGEGTRSARRPQTSHTFLPEGEVGVRSFLSNVEHFTHGDKTEGPWPWCPAFTQPIREELPGFLRL